MRTIQIDTTSSALRAYDRNGQLHNLGTIAVDKYGEEGIKRHNFYPETNSPWAQYFRKADLEKGYSLGLGTDAIGFINPAEAQQVLLDRGLSIVDQYVYGGGSTITTIFAQLDKPQDDPLEEDLTLWTPYISKRGLKVGQIFHSIVLQTSLSIGVQAARYNEGFFRLVCQNGMSHSLLQLPTVQYNHATWEISKVPAHLDAAGFSSDRQFVRGPVIGTVKSLSAGVNALSKFSDYLDDHKTPDQRFESTMFRPFMPSTMNRKVLHSLLTTLDALLVKREGDIYTVDIINAYTSAINLERSRLNSERGAFYNYSQNEAVVTGLVSLSQMASLFEDVRVKTFFDTSRPVADVVEKTYPKIGRVDVNENGDPIIVEEEHPTGEHIDTDPILEDDPEMQEEIGDGITGNDFANFLEQHR
jgi:hypothetical protein